MWTTLLKYGVLSAALLIMGFFIMKKNIDYKELDKHERTLLKKIYEAEEKRRYALYELEKLKKEKHYVDGSKRIIILNPQENQ